MATATTRRKASLSSAERLIVVLVVYVVVKLSMSSEAAKNIKITSYCSLLKLLQRIKNRTNRPSPRSTTSRHRRWQKNSSVLKKLRETPRQLLYSAVKKKRTEISWLAAVHYPQSNPNRNADIADSADFRRFENKL